MSLKQTWISNNAIINNITRATASERSYKYKSKCVWPKLQKAKLDNDEDQSKEGKRSLIIHPTLKISFRYCWILNFIGWWSHDMLFPGQELFVHFLKEVLTDGSNTSNNTCPLIADLMAKHIEGQLKSSKGYILRIVELQRYRAPYRKTNSFSIGCSKKGHENMFKELEQVERLKNLAARWPSRRKRQHTSGIKYRGDLAEWLWSILEDLTADNTTPSILFIDAMHTSVWVIVLRRTFRTQWDRKLQIPHQYNNLAHLWREKNQGQWDAPRNLQHIKERKITNNKWSKTKDNIN